MKVTYLNADAVSIAAAKLLGVETDVAFADASRDGSHWIVDHYRVQNGQWHKVQYRATFPFGEIVLVPVDTVAKYQSLAA